MLRCAASSLHPRFLPLWAGQPLAYPTVQKTGTAARVSTYAPSQRSILAYEESADVVRRNCGAFAMNRPRHCNFTLASILEIARRCGGWLRISLRGEHN